MNKRIICLLIIMSPCLWGSQDSTTYQKLGIQMVGLFPNPNGQVRFGQKDIYGNGIYSIVDIHFGNLTIFNSMFITSDSIEALKGGHKRVKGIFGYTNQAYLDFHYPAKMGLKLHGLIGRDYLRTGFSKGGSLLIGDESRPFDQGMVMIQYKDFIFKTAGIQLDNIGNNRRYLTLHTLKINYLQKLSLIVGEGLLYSGQNRSLDWQYFNPLIFWTPEMVNNTTGDGNGFIYGAFTVYPNQELSIWGELMIDDFQMNHKNQGDLEPNETGLILGIGYVKGKKLNTWIEYIRITNRTYQTPNPAETYMHRGFPIGHYLGNDFDLLQFHYDLETKRYELNPYIDIAYLRDGANGLDTPWDEPWMDSTITLSTGYSEPFPTRPITYTTELEFGVERKLWRDSFITTGLFWQRKEKEGRVRSDYGITLRLWISLQKEFNY